MKARIILVEYCDYLTYPLGGHLTFAKQMVKAFGNELALVGVSCDKTVEIGMWSKRVINNVEFDFFNLKNVKPHETKDLIPARIKAFLIINKFKSHILKYGSLNLFIQTPEVFSIFKDLPGLNICLRLPGLGNPLLISRYPFVKLFANLYEDWLYKNLDKASVILAAAGKKTIDEFVNKGRNRFDVNKLIQFPTRYDDTIFSPGEKNSARDRLNLALNSTIVITTGRLNYHKGWELMLESFALFQLKVCNSIFLLIGDGEDRGKIQKYVNNRNLSEASRIIGKVSSDRLADYLNSADIFIMGSFAEGWSTSIVEAVATGLPICTTDFSSATDLVKDGINGYVLRTRDKVEFSEKMLQCATLSKELLISMSEEIKYLGSSNLKEDILSVWEI